MVVANLKSAEGVKALNAVLADKSYLSGYQPSQDDASAFDGLGKAPGADTPHVLRWYNHIKSYSADERKKFAAGSGAAPKAAAPAPAAADDDDVDLFGSDEEDTAEADRIKAERVAAYNEKKSKKPVLIAKSSIVLDVKPWDDETDMAAMEAQVRTIIKDGLVWGASKLVPVGYGIKKLQIMCVVEDDKISVDELSEEIQAFEDFVQSVDIAAFNKI